MFRHAEPTVDERGNTSAPITADVEEPAARFSEALLDFEHQSTTLGITDDVQVRTLRDQYRYAVRWLRNSTNIVLHEDPTHQFVIDQAVLRVADELERTALELERAYDTRSPIDQDRLRELHRHLASIFPA